MLVEDIGSIKDRLHKRARLNKGNHYHQQLRKRVIQYQCIKHLLIS